MDKRQFIDRAPEYYALALATALQDVSGASTIEHLNGSLEDRLEHRPLILAGMLILLEADVVAAIDDDFGPTMYEATNRLYVWTSKSDNPLSLFRKFRRLGSDKTWLIQALKSVNDEYRRLEITAEDFDPAVEAKEWEPIPVDRSDEKLNIAISKLDQAIEVIEGDNGYAANIPAEREYVVSNLKAISTKLKEEAQIYWMQIKTFGIDPLTTVAKRFGKAAAGLAATAAKDAIIDWLKDNFHRLFF